MIIDLIRHFIIFLKLYNNRYISKDKLKKLKNKKIKNLIKHIYSNSEYYHDYLINKGFNKDNIDTIKLSDLPFINKNIFIENFNKIITTKAISDEAFKVLDERIENSDNKNFVYNGFHYIHSSGSTGKRAYFFYDNKAWGVLEAAVLRAALWNMSLPEIIKLYFKKPKMIYIAATEGPFAGSTTVVSEAKTLCFDIIEISVELPLADIVKKVKEFNPDIIVGYPSAIKIVTNALNDGKVKFDVKRVITCGEPLKNQVEKLIEHTFHSDVINVYGASESVIVGISSNKDSYMYLFDDLNIVEVVDGKMYLTSLYNYTQPIIRYYIGDTLKFLDSDSNDPCPFTKVNIVDGRDEDMICLINKDGDKDFIHPLAIDGIRIEGMLDYQFVKKDVDAFDMNIELENDADENKIRTEIMDIMNSIFKEKKFDNVKFNINFVKELVIDKKSGKKKLII